MELSKYKNNPKTIIGLIISIALAFLVGVFMLVGQVRVQLSEDGVLTVSGTLTKSFECNLSDVELLELKENVRIGSRKVGIATARVSCGSYSNVDFGDYRLYKYKDVDVLIHVKTSDGRHLAFNLANSTATRVYFDDLSEKLPD